MKQKIFITAVIILISVACHQAYAQSGLIIKLSGGNNSSYSISEISKLTFSGSSLVVNHVSGTETPYALSDISSILFNAESSSIESEAVKDTEQFSVYPNPATDVIYVNANINSSENVKIYNTAGSLALSTYISSANDPIQIETLPQGVYILKINNQALKFLKK